MKTKTFSINGGQVDASRRAILKIAGFGAAAAFIPKSILNAQNCPLKPYIENPHEKGNYPVSYEGMKKAVELINFGWEKISARDLIHETGWISLSDKPNLCRARSIGFSQKEEISGQEYSVPYVLLLSRLKNPDTRIIGPQDVYVQVLENPLRHMHNCMHNLKDNTPHLIITVENGKVEVSIPGLLSQTALSPKSVEEV